MFKSHVDPDEKKEANRKLPGLMVEGVAVGSTGLGVLALIFEIAADAHLVWPLIRHCWRWCRWLSSNRHSCVYCFVGSPVSASYWPTAGAYLRPTRAAAVFARRNIGAKLPKLEQASS